MNLIDYLIITILILAALVGFKKGFLNSVVAFVGTLVVIIVAYYLKNPVSSFLYGYLPFWSLGGKFAGITVFNILIYEGISYLLTISLLAIILGVIAKVTGAFEKLLRATIVLALPSKILGALFGLLEGYILIFIIIFILNLTGAGALINNSKYAEPVLEYTPVLSGVVKNTYQSISEVYEICTDYKDSDNKEEANLKSLNVLLKYEILSVSSADKLVELGKLTTNGSKDVIDRYRGGE